MKKNTTLVLSVSNEIVYQVHGMEGQITNLIHERNIMGWEIETHHLLKIVNSLIMDLICDIVAIIHLIIKILPIIHANIPGQTLFMIHGIMQGTQTILIRMKVREEVMAGYSQDLCDLIHLGNKTITLITVAMIFLVATISIGRVFPNTRDISIHTIRKVPRIRVFPLDHRLGNLRPFLAITPPHIMPPHIMPPKHKTGHPR
mmetsp:Transcript_26786/g.49210  ORF Transcript_26786/g.49210 Transcript_26786/m.49210 type:complete len:202 (+) Transcript_26786:467-1072(+)